LIEFDNEVTKKVHECLLVFVVSDQEIFDCADLYSTQEEADTHMILQALHADKRLKNWESKTGSLSKPLI
jgi:hypothetical protein